MQKFLPLLLLLCFASVATAQVVISAEQQTTSPVFVLQLALPISVEFDVINYKITYSTTDALGQPDTATGLLSLPDQSELVLPLVVYNHGTVGSRTEVPSVEGVLERLLVAGLAGNRFIALAPDYLGLGDSDGIHPYLHAVTEARAGQDMVIAVRKWLDEQDIAENGQLFVTGYSQGGHASMALHRTLEAAADSTDLEITAAAHLSGVYDITPPSPLLLGVKEVDPGALSFFLNTLISYDYVYDLYGGIEGFLVSPYREEAQRFLDEEIDLYEMGREIDTLLRANDAVVGEMFTAEFVTDVLDGDAALLAAFNANDVYDWAPTAPTLLYYCNADETVDPAQSLLADSVQRRNGADSLLLVDGGALDHGACAIPAAVRMLQFFQGFANVYSVGLGTVRQRPAVRVTPNPVVAGQLLRFTGLAAAERPYALYDGTGRLLLQGHTSANGGLPLPATFPRGMAVVRLGLADGTSLVRKILVR